VNNATAEGEEVRDSGGSCNNKRWIFLGRKSGEATHKLGYREGYVGEKATKDPNGRGFVSKKKERERKRASDE